MLMESEVAFRSKGFEFRAFCCRPDDGALPKAHVLVVHEIHGLTDQIRDICRFLAENGYTAFAPDLWSRVGTPDLPDHNAILRKLQETPDKLVLEHIKDAINHLKQTENPRKLAVFGLGIGGTWAMLLSAESEVELNACVSFYGTLIREPAAYKMNPIDHLDGMRCPLLFVSGALDDVPVVVPKHDVVRLGKAAQEKGKQCRTILVEKAGYAFCNPALKHYDEVICRDALDQVVNFLDEKL